MLVPKQFQGSKEQANVNFRTHKWGFEESRCMDCDSKMWHKSAEYPCGENPPMIEVDSQEFELDNPIMRQFIAALESTNVTENTP